MRVGDIEILPVLDGVARFPISDPFLGMPEEAWLPHRQFLTSNEEVELALGGFVVRDGDRVILIDTGVGRVDSPPFKGGAFLTNLGALGVEPADVTDVIFTHLHFDHVGWATQQGTVVFPNATYRCDERDWGHFVGPVHRYVADRTLGQAGQRDAQLVGPPFRLLGRRHSLDVANLPGFDGVGDGDNEKVRRRARSKALHHSALDVFDSGLGRALLGAHAHSISPDANRVIYPTFARRAPACSLQ